MFAIPDGPSAFFIACFLLGLLFIVASAALGLAHDVTHLAGFGHGGGDGAGAGDIHAGGDGAGVGDAHAGGDGVGHADPAGPAGPADTSAHGDGGHAAGRGADAPSASPFNLMTAMAFLTWFGAAGYILHGLLLWPLAAALLAAVAAGTLGGWLVYLFLVKVLLPGTAPPDPRDFQIVGSLGRVSMAIPAGGSGEVVYTLGGALHGDGARSVNGGAIARDAEVVIVRFERGMAYVQTFESLRDEDRATGFERLPDRPSAGEDVRSERREPD